VAFIRRRRRGKRVYYDVVESRRVEGKRRCVQKPLLVLGEEPDIEKHLTEARRRLAALRRVLRKCQTLQHFAAQPSEARPDNADAARAHGAAFGRAVVAVVVQDIADAEAHLGKLREVRRKLKESERLR